MASLTIHYGGARPMHVTGHIQARMLGFAEKYRGWHSVHKNAMRTALALAAKGYIELCGDQFRFTYPRDANHA